MARASLKGERELIANLRRIARQAQSAEIDSAAVGSLQILANDMAIRAPLSSLKSGIAIVRRRGQSQNRREYWVAFKRGIAMRIAHLVEFGTQPHSMAKGASVRKGLLQDQPPWSPGTPPRPFARPAFEATKGAVVQRLSSSLWSILTAGMRSGR